VPRGIAWDSVLDLWECAKNAVGIGMLDDGFKYSFSCMRSSPGACWKGRGREQQACRSNDAHDAGRALTDTGSDYWDCSWDGEQ